MPDTLFHENESDNGTSHPKIYSASLQPLLQSLLATLADIDFDYEKECERASRTAPDINNRIRALEKIKLRHRERREPYIQQLAVLQRRMMELKAG